MRILYSHRIQSRDGQGVHLDSMVAALRAQGHEVRLVGPSSYEQAGFGGENRLVSRIRALLPRAVAELAELAYNVPAWWRLRRAAAEFRPDAIYERCNLFFIAGALVARQRGLPYLLEVNSPLTDERAKFGGLSLERLARWTETFVWRAADRALPVTSVLADDMVAAGVERERITVVPNGIDLEEYPEPPQPDPAAGREIVLGFVGFVREWHGLEHVVRGIAEWKGASPLALVVVGEGPARPGLEKLAAELGITERVRFTGLAERHAIPGLVARFDVALQPAATPYASPLKLFEYMAAGRAIVAPDQPNLREVLEHERNALLFRAGAPDAMWEALKRLAGDDLLRRRMGAAARADILARDMTWAGNARRVVSFADAEIARRRATLGPSAASVR